MRWPRSPDVRHSTSAIRVVSIWSAVLSPVVVELYPGVPKRNQEPGLSYGSNTAYTRARKFTT